MAPGLVGCFFDFASSIKFLFSQKKKKNSQLKKKKNGLNVAPPMYESIPRKKFPSFSMLLATKF